MLLYVKKIPLKIWFFAFAVVLLTVSVLQTQIVGATPEDEEAAKQAALQKLVEQYDYDHVSLRGAIVSYHKNMNEIFNEYIEKLLSGEMNGDQPKYSTEAPVFDSDEDTPDGEVYCKNHPDNVSTYCLSVAVVDEYVAFMKAMDTHRVEFEDSINDEYSDIKMCEDKSNWSLKCGWLNAGDVRSSELALQSLNERVDFIDEQVALAANVFTVALATYNELQVFYVLHQEYYGLIDDLESYRDALSKVRTEVERYPGKFHDVTTTDCT